VRSHLAEAIVGIAVELAIPMATILKRRFMGRCASASAFTREAGIVTAPSLVCGSTRPFTE
jgi:hypothetical protein